MRILDWRPRSERYLTSLWRGQASGSVQRIGWGGRLWADCHRRVVSYRVRKRPVPSGKPFVISVGNLALGGTGKTPVVIALAQDLATRGYDGSVLTRGYRSPLAGPLEVTVDNALAGDEARLLADTLADTQWPIVQARTRALGLRYLLAKDTPPAVVLLEDGHQTAGVGRDLDILILDNWTVLDTAEGPRVGVRTGQVFPFGPWRESADGARRAQILLLETDTEVPVSGLWGSQVVTFQRSFACRAANSAAEREVRPRNPALVSGIARPAKFEAGSRQLLDTEPELAIRLADHAPYGPRLLDRVRKAMAEAYCDSLVTTAKDWIKMAPFWPEELPAYIVDLAIEWGKGKTLTDLVGERLGATIGVEETP